MTEKRSVSTDALETLGSIIGVAEKRDAIHLAVEPTMAAEKLYPGQDVGVDGSRNNPVGIVDPFLKSPVMRGERFWLVLYPRQITSLRHVWSHPAFSEEPVIELKTAPKMREESEAWLRNFCKTKDCPNYESVMEVISSDEDHGGDSDDYGWWKDDKSIGFRGSDAHADIPPEFWEHVEVVLGRKVRQRPDHFTCSC